VKRQWRRILSLAFLLAFLAGQVEAAHHCFEHCDDAEHSSENCPLCAFAHQPVLFVSFELPTLVVEAMGEASTPDLPAPPQCARQFPFGPRSPPWVAPL
jgi:hypothetical protein